jgi:ferredoxin
MGKVNIIHEPETCIGCAACVAVCPKLFEMADNGKCRLKGSKTVKQNEMDSSGVTFNDVVEVDDPGCAQEAADVCPVRCIHVKKK